jgi:hypothetical protein
MTEIHTAAVTTSIVVDAPVERAFAVFTEDMAGWWPPEHHIIAAPLADMVLEPLPLPADDSGQRRAGLAHREQPGLPDRSTRRGPGDPDASETFGIDRIDNPRGRGPVTEKKGFFSVDRIHVTL